MQVVYGSRYYGFYILSSPLILWIEQVTREANGPKDQRHIGIPVEFNVDKRAYSVL